MFYIRHVSRVSYIVLRNECLIFVASAVWRVSVQLVPFVLILHLYIVCQFVASSCYSTASDSPHRRRRADHSIVFVRWRQYSPPSNTWFPGVTDLYPKRLHLGRFSHFARHWCSQHTQRHRNIQLTTTDNWFYWAHLQPPGAELLNKLWYRPGKNNKN